MLRTPLFSAHPFFTLFARGAREWHFVTSPSLLLFSTTTMKPSPLSPSTPHLSTIHERKTGAPPTPPRTQPSSPSLPLSPPPPSLPSVLPPVKKQRHHREFGPRERKFLAETLNGAYRIIYSIDDPFPPCSCVALSAYVREIFSSATDVPVLSQDPYICIACWKAYQNGEKDRIENRPRYRTYYDFQKQGLLSLELPSIDDLSPPPEGNATSVPTSRQSPCIDPDPPN